MSKSVTSKRTQLQTRILKRLHVTALRLLQRIYTVMVSTSKHCRPNLLAIYTLLLLINRKFANFLMKRVPKKITVCPVV